MRSRRRRIIVLACSLLVGTAALAACPSAALADLMIIGNNEKVDVGRRRKAESLLGPGKDTVSIVDIKDPESPKIVVSLPLTNSIFGPPTNLAITPDGGWPWSRTPSPACRMARVEAGARQQALRHRPEDESAPHIATVEVGKQPSGLEINRAGNLASWPTGPTTPSAC